jgi:hypothetical protein
MLVLASLSFAQNQTLTKEQAIEIANTLTVQQDVNVYISKQTISQKREIVTMYKPIFAPENESYLVFIDEQPYESWWHDCKYVFIDVNSSKYEVINMKYPPDLEEMEVVKEKKVAEKGGLFQLNLGYFYRNVLKFKIFLLILRFVTKCGQIFIFNHFIF